MRRVLRAAVCLALAVMLLPLSHALADDRQFLLDHLSALSPEQIPKTPAGIRHFLLISMDKWQNNPENPGYNDGLVILTLDELAGRVMVTSIIRDLLVIRPDGTPGRINRVIRLYDVQGLIDTINRHFGLRIEKYVVMDWRHIMEIVDAAGGANVTLTSTEVSYLKGWSVPVGSTQPVLDRPGDYRLNGFAAVVYMRIRKRRASNDIDTQDFGRTFRVRTVMASLADSLRDADMGQIQRLLSSVLRILEQPFDQQYTYPGIRNNNIFRVGSPPKDPARRRYATNITMADFLDAARVVYALRGTHVEECRLPFDGTVKPFTYANGAAQLCDFEANRRLLHEFMFPESFIVTDTTP
ncbi:MAG TPA: LCP family protein [Candidatus Limnocylindria bacterium]|nr:LCP family protein [Candidatus Limnocylindria bacterium]